MNHSKRFGSSAGRVLVILHQENSTPARVGRLLRELGYDLDIRRPRFGDPLPKTMADHDAAVIFGGPQSANDGDDYIRAEIDFVGVPLKEDKPLLGICLGAQMMARHLGERVYIHSDKSAEVGYYPLKPTDDARGLCSEPFPAWVYQWHKEGFDLPRDATLLAEGGDLFPVQAFQYGKATAIQFHPEVTYAMIWRWTTFGHERLTVPNAQDRQEHFSNWFVHDPAIARWLKSFVSTWVSAGACAPAVQSVRTSAQ